jgi:hypothetical protein
MPRELPAGRELPKLTLALRLLECPPGPGESFRDAKQGLGAVIAVEEDGARIAALRMPYRLDRRPAYVARMFLEVAREARHERGSTVQEVDVLRSIQEALLRKYLPGVPHDLGCVDTACRRVGAALRTLLRLPENPYRGSAKKGRGFLDLSLLRTLGEIQVDPLEARSEPPLLVRDRPFPFVNVAGRLPNPPRALATPCRSPTSPDGPGPRRPRSPRRVEAEPSEEARVKEPLFGIWEAARRLGVDRATVRRLVDDLELGRCVSGRVVLDQDDLDAIEDALDDEESVGSDEEE